MSRALAKKSGVAAAQRPELHRELGLGYTLLGIKCDLRKAIRED